MPMAAEAELDLSDHHERAIKRGRRWAWVLGAVGVAGAGLIAYVSFEYITYLFSTMFPIDPATVPAGSLRPTRHYELGMGIGLTLLYFTLYLWVMRIAIRMFMTEHHLAIDARSRARMAETYLALTLEERAEPADRAIVLAALFRPVVDGIVKDDAMPLISPSAILAELAIGRSKS